MEKLAKPILKAKALIAHIQKNHKMSQAQIARFLDIPEGTLNAWMNGSVRCRHDKILMLALAELKRRLDG